MTISDKVDFLMAKAEIAGFEVTLQELVKASEGLRDNDLGRILAEHDAIEHRLDELNIDIMKYNGD